MNMYLFTISLHGKPTSNSRVCRRTYSGLKKTKETN